MNWPRIEGVTTFNLDAGFPVQAPSIKPGKHVEAGGETSKDPGSIPGASTIMSEKSCSCRKCQTANGAKQFAQDLGGGSSALWNVGFAVFPGCPVCGNKRCPKGTDHDLQCTNSNEPGQPGSIYG